ncbi:hypothetical protein BDZ91DRAFT_717629 [Kalaharituber pfeilii]|nr:hypothetical protein BDZ91DRAFT_717629 [Kalaharituber pfeilii]
MQNPLQRNAFSSAKYFSLHEILLSSAKNPIPVKYSKYSKLWRIILKYRCIYKDSKISKASNCERLREYMSK